MSDEEIAKALVDVIQVVFRNWPKTDRRDYSFAVQVSVYLDDAEDYRLAFENDAFYRASMKRQQKRVRKLVFAALKLPDPAVVEK